MDTLKETNALEVPTNLVEGAGVTTGKEETNDGPKLTYRVTGSVSYTEVDEEGEVDDCDFEEEEEFCTGIPLESRMQCMDYIHRRLEEFKTRSFISEDYAYVGNERELYLSPVSNDWTPLPEAPYYLIYEVKLVVKTASSKFEYTLFKYTYDGGEIEPETFHENLIIESSYYQS